MPDGSSLGGFVALVAATPKPVGPSPSPNAPSFDPNDVTPGTIGFVVTFAMVIVVIFLLRDFSKRVRRITIKGEEMERSAAEVASKAAAATGAASTGAAPKGAEKPGGSGSGVTMAKGRKPPSLKKPSGGTPTG